MTIWYTCVVLTWLAVVIVLSPSCS
jgi:hypothetical protein